MPQCLATPTNILLCVLKSWLMPVMLVLGLWLPVGAQTPGSASGIIAGKVVNPAGTALTEAEVIAREDSTGLERK